MGAPYTPEIKRVQLTQPWSVGRVCVVRACAHTHTHAHLYTQIHTDMKYSYNNYLPQLFSWLHFRTLSYFPDLSCDWSRKCNQSMQQRQLRWMYKPNLQRRRPSDYETLITANVDPSNTPVQQSPLLYPFYRGRNRGTGRLKLLGRGHIAST